MAKLFDYRVAKFSQVAILKGDFAFKKMAQGGVCMALVISWVRVGESEKVNDADDLMDAVEKDFDLSISKQSILGEAMKQFAVAKDSAETAIKWNSVSIVTGIKFDSVVDGKDVDPFVVATYKRPDGMYLLRIIFINGSSHALGIGKSGAGALVFDPNYGLFVTQSTEQLRDFATALWARYRSSGNTIDRWQLFHMSKAETARERMVKALAALT